MGFGDGKILVPDDGRRSARLVLVGEAPGKREVSQRRPFVGPSGLRLRDWWAQVGLQRSDFYITNVVPYLPAAIDKLKPAEIQYWIGQLHERLAALDDPWLIVPTGNYALYALTRQGKVSYDRDGAGIVAYRGSILATVLRDGRTIKVIPTIHPAATFARRGEATTSQSKAAQYTRLCVADWHRIAADAEFRELRLPKRSHYIKPTLDDVHDFAREARVHARELSLDIETPYERLPFVQEAASGRWVREGSIPDDAVARYKSGVKRGQLKRKLQETYASIGCIGFAYSPDWSLTIPTTLAYWRDEATLRQVWHVVRELCELPAEKILQNGQFDWYWLLTQPELCGMAVRAWHWDTRCMSHALDPTAMHDLATLASLWTRENYWKAEAKDPDSLRKFATNDEKLWIYNGKDVCVTLEIKRALEAELRRCGMLAFYERHYAAMFEPLLRMALHGIAMSDEQRSARLAELETAAAAARERVTEAAGGVELIPKKAVSATRLKKHLYETLALPVQYRKRAKGGGRTISTDEVALRRLADKFPEQAGELVGAILAHRNALKEAEFMANGKADADGRLRCTFSLCTAAGRLASQENPRGTGRNLQNVKRGATRAIFLPDN